MINLDMNLTGILLPTLETYNVEQWILNNKLLVYLSQLGCENRQSVIKRKERVLANLHYTTCLDNEHETARVLIGRSNRPLNTPLPLLGLVLVPSMTNPD
ncbi:hypothetical protein PoB_004772800 [Plakobranchus ocellatus]|uniref:Uncharacterized protein n=1 Tax=Plakobranchus ocellatus TaxID=259542 RepID=A0AAV4BQY8_9GAST|nr:hypothetical protein PoB_004772800 [Plakobranchus ocellatus]